MTRARRAASSRSMTVAANTADHGRSPRTRTQNLACTEARDGSVVLGRAGGRPGVAAHSGDVRDGPSRHQLKKGEARMTQVRASSGLKNSLNWREQRWYSDAACRSQVSSRWFSNDGPTSEGALSICHSCPVEPECLALALEHHELAGIWGGTTQAQRARLRRSPGPTNDHRATAAAETPTH